jgi:hypothetical protein
MRVIFILSICILFASCGKKKTIVITATNGATGERYVGLQYSVVSTLISATDGKSTKTVASGVLDVNGEASFQLRAKQGRTYAVRVVAPENNCYNENSTIFFGSPNDKNGHFDFVFAPCAYFKLNINNVNCQGATDYFKLYYMGRQVGGQGSGIVGALSKEGGGCYSFLASSFSSVPMGEMYWKWEVTKNSITNIYYDTIYLSPGEYKVYDINY